jgi:NADPH2:quinone reductase
VKAAVIYENGGPEALCYQEVPDPGCPDRCVVVDAESISIEGGDLLARAQGALPSVPHVVGYLSGRARKFVGGRVQAVGSLR